MTEVPEEERAVGMDVYATPSPPCSVRLRTLPSDFQVEEVLFQYKISADPGSGSFPVYRVEKRLVDTLHMAEELSEAVRSRVAFGGLKDKRAVAVQYVTPTSTRAKKLETVERDGFSARLVGYSDRPMSAGSVIGNRFRINLRECCQDVKERVDEVLRLGGEGRLPNFFGLQRFGRLGGGTHDLGRGIVKREFRNVVERMLSSVGPEDDGQTREAKEAMAKERYEEGLRLLPAGFDTERMVAARLAKSPGNFVGALRAAPVRLRRLFVHAYQSFIFNRAVSLALARGVDISGCETGDNWTEIVEEELAMGKVHGVGDVPSSGAVPMVQLPGYAFRDYGSRFDSLVGEVMAQEGVSARDFYVLELQEASAEGGFRVPRLLVAGSSCAMEGETAVVGFTLARGQYATVLLREAVKPANPIESGFG